MYICTYVVKIDKMKEIACSQLDKLPVNNFYQAILIYLTKAQVVNRKLSCSSNVLFYKWSECELKVNILTKLQETICHGQEDVKSLLKSLDVEFSETDIDDLREIDDSDNGVYLSIDQMTPRNLQKFDSCLQACLIGLFEVLQFYNL